MAAPTDADIIAVAQAYSIPPAILLGIVRQQGASPTFNVPQATIGAYGLALGDVQGNPSLALDIAARALSQSFAQYGSWESALSVYLTGNPNSYQSPTSSVGGQVNAIIGTAAVNASFGMAGYTPTSMAPFAAGAEAFGKNVQDLVQMGGVVTQDTARQYQSSFHQVTLGSVPYRSQANLQQAMTDVLTAAKLPVTPANLALLTTMARGEGMSPGTNNWLATTTKEPGSQQFNSVGVQIFPDYQEGVDATARTLLNGNYQQLIKMMQQGADLQQMAQDPGVQQNLKTWQGGSSEDVNNLLRTSNVPGTAPPQTTPAKPDQHTPAEVGEFATQLQGAGIDPKQFSQYFSVLAAHRRQLLDAKRTDVSDYADMQQAVTSVGGAVTNASIIAHLRAQPHPTYPTVSVGAFHDTQSTAALWSVTHTNQFPTDGEIARLVGLDNKEIANYYSQKAQVKSQQAGPTAPAQTAPQGQQPQSGKILQMEKSA
jgi:hypothetical protein